MDDPFWQWMIGILWAITTVFMAWTWIPAILSSMGKTRFLAHLDAEIDELSPENREATEPEYVDWWEQLMSLGFEPAGQGWMRVVEAGHHWMMQSNIRIFYLRSERCFAILQREAPPLDLWYSVTFANCMTDGGMVLNGNVQLPATVVHPMYISGGMTTANLGELLAFHQAIIRNEITQYNRLPDTSGSLEMLEQGLLGFFEHIARYRFQKQGRRYLMSEGLIHLCVSLPAGLAFGAEHWGLPLCNLILYGALRLGEYAEARRQADGMAQVVRSQARNRLEERRTVE